MTALASILKWCLEYWYVVALAALIGALALYGQNMRGQRDAARLETAEARQEFADYKAAQRAAEAKQAREALAQAIANERRKEAADVENARTLAAALADADRVRVERDAAVSSFLSAKRSGSSCPDDQACFGRAEFDAAYRVLVGEVRAIARECTALTVDLDTARRWAQER